MTQRGEIVSTVTEKSRKADLSGKLEQDKLSIQTSWLEKNNHIAKQQSGTGMDMIYLCRTPPVTMEKQVCQSSLFLDMYFPQGGIFL